MGFFGRMELIRDFFIIVEEILRCAINVKSVTTNSFKRKPRCINLINPKFLHVQPPHSSKTCPTHPNITRKSPIAAYRTSRFFLETSPSAATSHFIFLLAPPRLPLFFFWLPFCSSNIHVLHPKLRIQNCCSEFGKRAGLLLREQRGGPVLKGRLVFYKI